MPDNDNEIANIAGETFPNGHPLLSVVLVPSGEGDSRDVGIAGIHEVKATMNATEKKAVVFHVANFLARAVDPGAERDQPERFRLAAILLDEAATLARECRETFLRGN